MARKTLLSWSSGKDSAWALHALRRDPSVELVGLLTTLNEVVGRVAMHGVRESLLEAQSRAVELPLTKVFIPEPCTNEDYEAAMGAAMSEARVAGVEAIAFGDLFLEDIRQYREDKLAPTGIEPLFPLWGRDTRALAREMVESGLRAVVTCVDPERVPRELAGRTYDEVFLGDLPSDVDPCAERGEFHTFAYAGPMFSSPLGVDVGEVVERAGFVYADVLSQGLAG
jgi:uncharacterized protein (TIGR00290 family)